MEGVFTHGGHSYRRAGAAEGAASDEVSALADAAAALRGDGFEVRTISAGSTPTRLLAATGSVNEIRAGTYVLGDRHETVLAGTGPEELAAAVVATVVSRPSSDRFVVDAGAKALTKDRADFVEGFGLVRGYPSAIVERLNDYHGVVSTNGGPAPELGESVAIVPNHICPVVDLFDRAVIVRGGRVIDQWRVDARGRSG